MTGLEEFLNLFGDITIEAIVGFILAIIFCIGVYSQIKKYLEKKKIILIEKHESEKSKDEQLQKVMEQVNNYPKYREQSRQIQQEFRQEIDELKNSQAAVATTQKEIQISLRDMQEKQERLERNKLRDTLLKSYRYYTDKTRNPEQIWTKMESEAFWDLFGEYEDRGGNGYIHTVVQPAMNLLKIVDN